MIKYSKRVKSRGAANHCTCKAVSTDQWKHRIDDQSSDDKIFLLLRTWKQVNETTNRITEHNRSMWWIFTHGKSGGSKSIAWPPTSKSGGSKDPLDPVLPRSMGDGASYWRLGWKFGVFRPTDILHAVFIARQYTDARYWYSKSARLSVHPHNALPISCHFRDWPRVWLV